MPTLTIEGKRVKVDDAFMQLSPEQQAATVEEIAGQLGIVAGGGESVAYKEGLNQLSGLTQAAAKRDGGSAGRSVDSFMRGVADMMTLGMADEGAASLMTLPGDVKGLQRNLFRQRVEQEQRDNQDPVSSTLGRVAGGLASGVGMARGGLSLVGRLAPTAGLGAKVAAGAAEGAAYGGAYGFGSGEDIGDRLAQGAGGAAMGGLIGGAVPAVASGVKAATKPIRDAVSARINPGGYASQKIAERLGASNLSVTEAMRKARPGENLADVGGESTRTLLRTAANIPGKAKDSISKTVTLRQFGQGDRLKAAIGRTFADPDGYLSAKDDIAATAKRIADPLYKRAYGKPIPFTRSLQDILETDAGRSALRKAKTLASNEQQPFKSWFANVADDGTFTRERVPDMRAWDYIKRSIDDMIDGQTDSITRKMSNEGRILVQLKNRMLNELDMHNPAYKQARAAFAGQAQIDDALEFGQKALRMSPDAVKRGIKDMNPAQKEAARVGAAEAMRKSLDDAGMTHNAALKIFSNNRQIQNLRTLFDNPKQFADFRSSIFSEMRKRKTYEAVKGNSTTAAQMADMLDAGGLAGQADTVKTAATQGMTAAALQFVSSRLRMLGGLTPEVADQIGKKLLTSNPQKLQELVQSLSAIESRNLSAATRQIAVSRALSDALRSATLEPALASLR
jgi:hypothetical protein